ncbi:MAG: DoxX family protein [Deltaproteobacteria bacterium]|nr:DoxX family protein [Deltaproteobacteria bacterium]
MIDSKWCCKICPEWATLILRLTVGITFFLHGSQKVLGAFGGGGLAGTAGFLSQLGFPMPEVMAYVLGFTEFLGGFGVLLGIGTRLFAALLACTMTVAILTVHLKNGFFASQGGFEFPFVLLGSSLALVCTGCQKWGLDCILHKKCCGTDNS